MSIVDWRELRLPNRLTLSGGLCVLLIGFGSGAGRAVLVGSLLLSGVYLLVHLVAPRSMGAGDVKAAIGLGGAAAMAGPDAWVLAALLAPVLTVIVGLIRRDQAIPHGPGMCGSAVLAIMMCA